MSSTRVRTPLQLYVEGALRFYGSGRQYISELFFDPSHGEDIHAADLRVYGVDWNGPAPLESYNNDTRLNNIPCPLSYEQLEKLRATGLPLSKSVDGHAGWRRTSKEQRWPNAEGTGSCQSTGKDQLLQYDVSSTSPHLMKIVITSRQALQQKHFLLQTRFHQIKTWFT